MTEVELTDDMLIVHVKGFDKFLSLKSQLKVPLTHVKGAESGPTILEQWQRLRLGARVGTHLPGVIKAGSFYYFDGERERVFWDVRHPQQALAINLADEHYTRLIVEVDDPSSTVASIEEAVRARQSS